MTIPESATTAPLPVAPGPAWHRMAAPDVLARLDTTAAGLSDAEALARLTASGANELQEAARISPFALFLGQFKSLIVWILIAAALVSGLLGEWVDCGAILTIVVLNALIGFYQEYSAERAITALKRMTAPQARVRRNGQTKLLPARDLVAGDIIELAAGDIVPADAYLLETASLRCTEAALTGESTPVGKVTGPLDDDDLPIGDRRNLVFMGTSCASGTALAATVATGMATELGKIASLMQGAEREETPLQKRLQAVGTGLLWVSLALVAGIFGLGWLRGMPIANLFLSSVSLAVAAIPEGLPAVVTIALAVGVQRMSRRQALVRRLPSVETLGATSVICSDKTGTLTMGEMTIRSLYAAGNVLTVLGEGYAPGGDIRQDGEPLNDAVRAVTGELLTVFAGCNNARLVETDGQWTILGDPTEAALLAASGRLGISRDGIEREHPRVREVPFDSDRKRMAIVRDWGTAGQRVLVKGAPDVILPLCTHILTETGSRAITGADRQRLADANAEMASRALRVLGAAYRTLDPGLDVHGEEPDALERGLVFAGLGGMYDPPRPEAKEAIRRCHAAGIRVVMITGDHLQTAMAVARELDLTGPETAGVQGTDLDGMSDAELTARVDRIAVYARVSAAHKLRIVRAWQAKAGVVAMTGDGVNDAPAIKGADVGVAMGRSGTEVTKEASDMVVTDDNFASIVAAVEEGRGVYANIRKTLGYLLSGNAAEVLFVASCLLVGLPMPLQPIHILWINLVTDGLPAIALATDPIDTDVMAQPPRPRDLPLADRPFLINLTVTCLLIAGTTMAAYVYALRTVSAEMAATVAFAVLVYAELLKSFSARSESRTISQVGLFSNLKLAAIVAVGFTLQPWMHHNATLQAIFQTVTMSWADCAALMLVGMAPVLVLEGIKVVRRRGRSWSRLSGRP